MRTAKVIGLVILGIVILVGLVIGGGWLKVYLTGSVGAAQQDVEREVFENTNSFVKAKRQDATKSYKEYLLADTEKERKAIEIYISMSLADFDEDKYIDNAKLLSWIKQMKY